MLASGADVEIEGTQFMLATDVEEPYIHQYENLYPTTAEVAGTDKKTANQNILLWSYDSFIEGGGLKYYDPDQPARWHKGENNPRIPGQIQSPPTKTASTEINPTSSITSAPMTVAGGRVWIFVGDQGWQSGDGTTWTENTDVATELPASYVVVNHGTASDGDSAYFAAADTDWGVWKADSTTTASDVVTPFNPPGNTPSEIAIQDNFLYAWGGDALYRYDLTASLPITHSESTNLVRRFRAGPVSLDGKGISAADNSLIFFSAEDGITELFEHRLDPQTGKKGTRQFATMANGFTAKSICAQGGVIYLLGNYQNKVALWGFSLQSHQPIFLGYVGEDEITGSNVTVRFVRPSYGAQVMLGIDDDTTAFIYIYDAEEDSFSLLDSQALVHVTQVPYDAATFLNRRIVSFIDVESGTDLNPTSWIFDSDTPAGAWDWDSAAWDMGYPQDEKVLLGFHIVQDPTIASGTVNVDYQLNEDGVWLDAGTTSAGAKHTYIQVSTGSTTRKFHTLRMRMTGASGCRVLSITARAYVNTKQEVWRLVLDLSNEPGTTRRLSDRTVRAARLRDLINTLVTTGSVVDFKDGRRYPDRNDTAGVGFTAHECLIEFPKDSIDSASEGRCEIILRSVDPSA